MSPSIHDLAPLYALRALDPDSEPEFIEHLPTCARCRAEIAEIRAAEVPAPNSPVSPPPELRDAVMARIASESQVAKPAAVPKRPAWRSPVPVAAAAAAVIILVVGAFALLRSDEPGPTEVAQKIQSRDDAVSLDLEPTGEAAGDVTLWLDGSERTVVEVRGLASPEPGSIYQLWFISGEVITPSRTFEPTDADAGSATFFIDGVPAETVAISVEPAGGSPAPTGEVVFAGSL